MLIDRALQANEQLADSLATRSAANGVKGTPLGIDQSRS
jgi:hypothetical protein